MGTPRKKAEAYAGRVPIKLVLPADMDIMARTIYGESRGEPYNGKLAVAHVILNRVAAEHRRETRIAGACTEPSQFSCWLPDDPNLKKLVAVTPDSPGFSDCMTAAQEALAEHNSGIDITKGALYYHTEAQPKWADTWPPRWARGHEPCTKVYNHLFYNTIP